MHAAGLLTVDAGRAPPALERVRCVRASVGATVPDRARWSLFRGRPACTTFPRRFSPSSVRCLTRRWVRGPLLSLPRRLCCYGRCVGARAACPRSLPVARAGHPPPCGIGCDLFRLNPFPPLLPLGLPHMHQPLFPPTSPCLH